MQKCLIVKEDGLIYAAEVPEEPKNCYDTTTSCSQWCVCPRMKDYQKALASAKESAVRVSDQEKAARMISINHQDCHHRIHPMKWEPKPGIYPIPDLQWELEHRELGKITIGEPASHTGTFWVNWKGGKTNTYLDDIVAILKESTHSETESQLEKDRMWVQVIDIYWKMKNEPVKMLRELSRQFTITRKP